MEIRQPDVSATWTSKYPRLNHEAFEAFYTCFVEGDEVFRVSWNYTSIEAHVNIALTLG